MEGRGGTSEGSVVALHTQTHITSPNPTAKNLPYLHNPPPPPHHTRKPTNQPVHPPTQRNKKNTRKHIKTNKHTKKQIHTYKNKQTQTHTPEETLEWREEEFESVLKNFFTLLVLVGVSKMESNRCCCPRNNC